MTVVSFSTTHSDASVSDEQRSFSRLVVDWVRALLANEMNPGAVKPAQLQELDTAISATKPEGLKWLVRVLGLQESEEALLLVAAATELEPALRVDWACLSGRAEWTYLTRSAFERLLDLPSLTVSPSGGLFAWRLVTEVQVGAQDPPALAIDPFGLALVVGHADWDPAIAHRLSKVPDVMPLGDWPVGETVALLKRTTAQAPARVFVRGSRGSGRRSFAQTVCGALGLPAVYLDSQGLSEEEFSALYLHAHRQALALGHALIWSEDYLLRPLPTVPLLSPVQFILADSVSSLPDGPGTVDETIVLGPPPMDEVRGLLRRYVPASVAWSSEERESLLRQYRVHVGDLAALSRRRFEGVEEARRACRHLGRGRLGEYAELLECPFSRDDLVIPQRLSSALEDFLYEASERRQFWEQESARRLFPRGRGLVGLFAGPPGTGKTMAAQVIAAELGLDLLRIDLAKVVSKYIGETAKNLRRVFSQVREMNAVLFFDEADSLFAQRTEVKDSHDRYANADTNYLLQHLEEFDGVALLATNRRANIDKAFLRRLRSVLDFPRPSVSERQVMFARLVDQLVAAPDPTLLDPGLRVLSEVFELSGAQIKLAVLNSVFSASRHGERVQVSHMVTGIERELAKEGRQIVKSEWARVHAGMRGANG